MLDFLKRFKKPVSKDNTSGNEEGNIPNPTASGSTASGASDSTASDASDSTSPSTPSSGGFTAPSTRDSTSPSTRDSTTPAASGSPASGGFTANLIQNLARTHQALRTGLSRLFLSHGTLNDEILETLEEALLSADVGVSTSKKILGALKTKIKNGHLKEKSELEAAFQSILKEILLPCEAPLSINPEIKPFVILVVGVNGSGKTTSIAKLAAFFKDQGKKVMLAAGDTFRAAAIEQLQIWGERHQIPVVAQHMNADSASVIFDALESAKARGVDILIADTAGRLHTQVGLMEELKKVQRVIQKLDKDAPHEVLLVLDASLGQNSVVQAEKFHQALKITGICLTKMDGTAKGGVIFTIADNFKLPIRFLGLGESALDLKVFNAEAFVNALLNETSK